MERRVLFVDDEMSILRSIKRSFFNTEYIVFIGNGAKEGLKILSENQIDVVVSDVKMPDMDGITFLSEVKLLYPNIDRIILSGFVEKESVLKAIVLGVAFDYITKPWENEVLFEKLDYIFLMRERLSNKNLVTFLNSIETLPKLPEVYGEFNRAVENDKSFKEISEIIGKDIAISTKVLQLVNSAFYARTKIGSIEQALQIIGLTGIKNILLYSSLSKDLTLSQGQKDDLKYYDNLTFVVNKLFIRIYQIIKGENPPQEFYMLGMILYIGKIILLCYFYERYLEIKEKMKSDENMTFWEAQISLNFGDCTHIEIGAYFLSLWNFPLEYFQVIFNYMTPYTAPEEIKEIIYMLNIARKYAESNLPDVIDGVLNSKNYDTQIKEYFDEYKR